MVQGSGLWNCPQLTTEDLGCSQSGCEDSCVSKIGGISNKRLHEEVVRQARWFSGRKQRALPSQTARIAGQDWLAQRNGTKQGWRQPTCEVGDNGSNVTPGMLGNCRDNDQGHVYLTQM